MQTEISSANAYMLVYKLASWTDTSMDAGLANGHADAAQGITAMEQDQGPAGTSESGIEVSANAADASPAPASGTDYAAAEAGVRSARLQALPPAVRERVDEVQADFEAACEAHERMKAQALQRVEERQQVCADAWAKIHAYASMHKGMLNVATTCLAIAESVSSPWFGKQPCIHNVVR